MIPADNHRPSTSRDSEDVPRRNHPSRDDCKINVEPNCEKKPYEIERGPTLGFQYQWAHLVFTLQCALRPNNSQSISPIESPSQNNSQFHLATEMVAAKKLDDVFLEYTNQDGKVVGRFMQVKHRSNDKKQILAESLLDESGDFSVSEYFKSWREVARNPEFGGIDSKNIILCTNANISLKSLERKKIEYVSASDPDGLFKLESTKKVTAWYKLKAKRECNVELYSKLKTVSHIYELAMRLAEHIYNGKADFLEFVIFQYYHLALAKANVISRRETNNTDGKKFQFCRDFIEDHDLSEKVRKFREIFLSEYRLRMTAQEDDKKNRPSIKISNVASEGEVWQNVNKRFGELNFSDGFGQSPKLVKDPQLTDVSKLSDRIVELLKDASKDYKKVIIVDKAEKVIRDNIDKLSGHVFIKKDDKIKFSPPFLKNSQNSEGNIGEFRSTVLKKLADYNPASFVFEIPESEICTEAELLTKDEMPEDDSVDDEEISRFLKEFTLAVNQPDFDELCDITGQNMHTITQSLNIPKARWLGDSFQTRLSHWFMKKGEEQGKKKKYLTYNVGQDMLDEMKGEVISIRSSGVTSIYCDPMKLYDVHFKSGMQPVEAFLSESRSGPIPERMLEVIAPENTLLTALRVYDTLHRMPKYEKGHGFIFTNVRNLQLPSVLDTVLAALELTRDDLLLVDCGSDSSDQYSRALWNPLYEVLKKRRCSEKKIILITQKDKSLSEQFENGHKTHEDDHNFQNLTDDTQKTLLEKPVSNFQGYRTEMSFGELLGIHDSSNIKHNESEDLSEIIDPSTLIDLIVKDKIHICNNLENWIEKDYYVNRTIRRQVIIKEDILNDEKISDLFAISSDHEELQSTLQKSTSEFPSMPDVVKKITILDRNREEDQFKALCKKHRAKHNIHWLKKHSDAYIWEKSEGDITRLVKYRVTGESDDLYANYMDFEALTTGLTLKDDEIAAHDEPVIVSSIAGMGKSTMLTYLSFKLKENQPNMLVIKINLNSHVEAFAKVQNTSSYNICDKDGAIEFLVMELLKRETDLLARNVIRRMIKEKSNVALIFDGFDEISPLYEETVINLLGTFEKHGIKKLFVATKHHTRETLEMKLKVFSYDIQPFQSENQEFFLNKYFKKDKALIEMAQGILEKLGESIDDRTNGFTGIPLHTKIIAEILQNPTPRNNSFGRFPDSHDGKPNYSQKINLIYLYNCFVEMKFDSFFVKRGANPADIDVIYQRQSELRRFIKTHTKLALDALFDEDKVKEFPFIELDPGIVIVRNGIITGFNDDGRPQFGHRSYAEYFAATYVVEMVKKSNLNKSIRKIFLADILVGDHYKTMRAFINCLWAEQQGNVFGVGFGEFRLDEHREIRHQTIFHVAVKEDNDQIIEKMENYICLNTDTESASLIINSPDHNGVTPLHLAAFRGSLKFVQYFCGKGANVHSVTKKGMTSLFLCTLRPYCVLDVVKFLLGKGADVNCKDFFGLTPLHAAAATGRLDIVKCLLDEKANLDSESATGITPLHVAALRGSLNVVGYLLSKGANVNSESKDGSTPLHAAAREGQLNVVKYLLSNRANVSSKRQDGLTPLHVAALQGQLNVVKYLLSKGANVDSESKDGWTPLHQAAQKGQLNVVKYLLSKRANVNSESKDGSTPLHAAAFNGQINVVEYLLSKRANVDSEMKDRRTPLHLAAYNGDLDVIKYLLGKEANVNSKNKDGRTPLFAAAFRGHLNVVKYLLSKGANVNCRSTYGDTPLHAAAQEGRLNIVKYFLSKRANVNCGDEYGRTPLHAAAHEGRLVIVKYLLSKGADVNSKLTDGRTPLHAAAQEGQLNVVEYLLRKRANVNCKDKDGRTPLHAAADGGKWDVVVYLLSQGANAKFQIRRIIYEF